MQRVCFGRSRVESQRWVTFRSFYGFDPFYCLPGKEGAHEKGGVEQEGGRFRRTHLVPVPEVESLAELNATIAQIDLAEEDRVLHGRNVSVGYAFREETQQLASLPGEDFDCGVTLTPRVSRDARITVRQCHYSVPARFIGARVRVSLRANELLVFDRATVVARHDRLTRRGCAHDVLDHYLEILLSKPGALAGSTALAAARAEGSFTATHEAFWAAARAVRGDSEGTRALIEVLLLHRHRQAEFVIAGIAEALRADTTNPEVVAIEARKADNAHREASPLLDEHDLNELGVEPTDPHQPSGDADNAGAEATTSSPRDPSSAHPRPATSVIPLRTRRDLPADYRPPPSVAIYDQLLSHRRKGSSA